jgi:8-oxo-dGTP pyrophosphatase MutT (NUDIX family)
VLDDELRLLLLRYVDETTGEPRWIPPGGAMEPGETHAEAARRELFEEIGLADAVIAACNWTRDIVWEWSGQAYRSREEWFLTRVPSGFRVESKALAQHEVIAESRWWSLADLDEGLAHGIDIRPRRLPEVVRLLLAEGPPATPVDIGR